MRTVNMHTLTTRHVRRIATLLLLTACLGACGQTAPQTPSIAGAATAAPATTASAANAALAVAVAREASSRAAREQTLRVQRHLVEQRRAIRDAERANNSERCLGGLRMRRVANGWVQAGVC